MPFGIDFGTTNSSVAWADSSGVVHSLKVRRGPKEPFDAVERSIVFDPLGPVPVVGHLAEGQEGQSDSRPLVSSIKPRFDKARLRQSRYEVVTTPTTEYDPVDQCIKFSTTERSVPVYYDDYSLHEVTAAAGLIFERLLTSTEIDPADGSIDPSQRSVLSRVLGRRSRTGTSEEMISIEPDPSERLFIGVPVGFGPTSRRRLLRSLVASGSFGSPPDAYRRVLDRSRLVYEPIALVTTLTLLEPQDVFVVDYGGGTLDLALVHVDFDEHGMRVTERALGGLRSAGDRIDELFREYLLDTKPRLRCAFDRQVSLGPEDRYRACSSFSRAKVELSSAETTVMRLFGDAEVKRSDLETAIATELDNMASAVEETFQRAGAQPSQVGTVLLTGGSSLIPAVQQRLRDAFPHLVDDLAFQAGTPGDVESERRALTGVSRGLARWGYRQTYESTSPCSFAVVIPDVPVTRTICLERGAPDVVDLDQSPPVRIPVRKGRRSVVLYSDLLRETYCGAIVDLEMPDGEIEVRVSAARDRFAPAFVVRRATGRELGRFDLEGMTARQLERWVEGDGEWMPIDRVHLESAFLTRPLEVGDFVEWRVNGSHRRGKVVSIRDVNANALIDQMEGFDPSAYVIEAARENGHVVNLGQITSTARTPWEIGDVRLV